MTKTVTIKLGEKLTSEEVKKFEEEIERAKTMPITFDKDCEELSPALLKSLKCAAAQRNRRRDA